MNPYILSFSDPTATLEAVGGKGMSLTRMVNAGLPVPGGFHITTAAYQKFVSANSLQACILDALAGVNPADPMALEQASARIGGFFAQGSIPAEIAAAIMAAYSALQNTPVAVRSSATAEDLPGASFAGQQETYLNIRGSQALMEAVKKCWASLWTARAIAYRLNNQIDQETVALAVVVQELVVAEAAGILFTANPVNGHRDELVINAAWGMGEAIVSGAVTPDTLTVKKDSGRILRRETAEKAVMTICTEDGVREQPVPAQERRKPVLNDSQAAELARLGAKIEQFYEMPMDIEWTLARGRFAIVQARPITALPPDWQVPEPGAIYARGSLAEHIPSPVTPLFATFGLEIANIATAQMWDRVLGEAAKNLIVRGGFYQPLNGYVYGGIRMKGRHVFSVIKMSLTQVSPMFRGSLARWEAARSQFAAVVETWEPKNVEILSSKELLAGMRAVFGAACRYFTDIQTTLPAASTSEVLFTRLYNSLIRRKQDPVATVFLLGSDTAAVRSEKSLYDIAAWLRENPALAGHVQRTPVEILLAEMAGSSAPGEISPAIWDEWRARFQAHLQTFGRTAYEFDFANPTPLETPGPFLDAMKAYLTGQAQDPYERQRETLARREQATQAAARRLGWPRRGWFLKMLRWAQETGPMREDAIFDMGMGHPLLRRMLGELGRRFTAQGAIHQPEDIYWLEKGEVEALAAALDTGQPLPDHSGCIPARKAGWQAALKITPPTMLPEKSGLSRFFHGGEAERKDGKLVLKGVGTSSGVVTAPACVLFGPEDFGRLQPGDVLIAVTTTPAWTPLFAVASAVVTDIGGPLSHSSIVAREYGIPAVMATRTGTRAIHSGQTVTVDGSKGTVTLE